MSDFVNPLADPNLTWKGKTLEERANELAKEKKKQELEAKLAKKRKLKEPATEPEEKASEEDNVSVVKDLVDCLVLQDISCCDADGNVFENYSRLHVAKDIFRNDKGEQLRKSLYGHAVFAEEQGLFLPSFALTCNILEALYQGKSDPEVDKVLMQYKDNGNGPGWHVQNTVVDWKKRQIVHYPVDNDFPEHGGNKNINNGGSRTSLGFKVKGFGYMLLKDALKKKEFRRYVMNLTGLKNPEILIEIGDYFGKPAKVWVPDNPEKVSYTSAAWLGCGINYFYIDADGNLGSSNASREVFEK